MRCPTPSPSAGLLLALLVTLGLLAGPPAHGQIAPARPAKVKAANRRALREAGRIESPYKETHLDVTRAQLRRGESAAGQPATDKATDYRHGTAPNVKASGSVRRTKTQKGQAQKK